jgi:hypothetical protein
MLGLNMEAHRFIAHHPRRRVGLTIEPMVLVAYKPTKGDRT